MSGSVYAIDPDIPIDRQRLAVAVTGDAVTHRLLLDKQDLGDASTAPLILPGRAGTGSRCSISAEGRRSGRLHDAMRVFRSAIAGSAPIAAADAAFARERVKMTAKAPGRALKSPGRLPLLGAYQ